ncbi:unnamed protein product [Paramecium primaurelia]|uniref:Cation-transporting P-type ATPase N-terminal domain-containing protein n=1 Tax=Paramecium primaurelia TaxID=5886 RepID=A0A8S1PK10_PARPR|nr:unnamed protein product [Paramecium primaurelia]
MNKGEQSQYLLEQSNNTKSFAENSSPNKSLVQYSIIQAMLEFKIKEHPIQPGELINSSIVEEAPRFLERGADYSSKMHDNENIMFNKQKPSQRMSHVYPSYMSENSIQIDQDKIEMIEHTYSVEQLQKILKTNIQDGLNDQQVQEKIAKFGLNKITSKHANVQLKEVFNLFTLALVIAIVLSLIGYLYDEKEHISFLIEIMSLIAVLVFTHIITFTSYQKKKKLFQQFNQIITNDEVIVIRNGQKQKISSEQLVKGDLIELNSNYKVPADCRIILSQQLSVDNFIFTGDCQPILLESEESNHKSIFEARNVAFLGVGCVFGEGRAIVINTGNQTILGKLAKNIDVPMSNSYIDFQVKKIIQITTLIIFSFIIITIIGWILEEYKNGQYDFTFLINTIIIIILSNLPFTLMLLISYSKRKIVSIMQDQSILLKDVDVIESLTQMSLLLINKEAVLVQGQQPKKIILDNQVYHINKIKNYQSLLNCIHYCIYQENYSLEESYNKQDIQQIMRQFIRDYRIDDYKIIQQRQFTAIERYCLTIVQNMQFKSQYIVYLMGSPEVIAQKLFRSGSQEDIEYLNSHKNLAKKGYSLISFAEKVLILDENYRFDIANTNEFNFNLNHATNLGTIALKLTITPIIRTVLQKLNLSGIRVVLMTGDFPETAEYIAQESQLVCNPKIVTGNDLEDHEQFDEDQQQNKQADEESINTKLCTQLNTIYARINPAQKLMVISAFQKQGYKVGMIGFDTIDSPALRKCDVSFALNRSDELAKQSSKVILISNQQQELEQILKCIYHGRRFTDNLIKQIKLCLSNKFGQFIPILLMLFLGIPLPLTSFGILYITFVLEILVLGVLNENEEVDIIIREPSNVKIFMKLQHFLRWILTHGVLAASSGMMSYLVTMHYFGFQSKSLPGIIYKTGYSNQIYNSTDFYNFNSSDQYLGNLNLINPQPLSQNPFITFQFYKHFNKEAQFDFRNVIVKYNETDLSWFTNFITSNSDICKLNDSELCYSYLSLDIAQLGFIYGFIMWGWLHVFLGRTRILSFRYQKLNKKLTYSYLISLFLVLLMYIPYMIYYFPDKDINFIGVIGLPCTPILILYFCFNEITSQRKLRKLKKIL